MTATTHIVRGCPSTTGNDRQLNTTTLIRHAARTHGDQEIVYRTPDGGWDRYTYADCYARVCRSARSTSPARMSEHSVCRWLASGPASVSFFRTVISADPAARSS